MAKNDNLGDFLKSLADKFRSKLSTTAKINPQDFESKVDEVYNKGKQEAYDAFWDGIQWEGQRTNYENAFQYWHDIGIDEPKHHIKIGSSYTDRYMFDNNTGIKKLTAAKYDFSEALCSDSNGATGGHCATFFGCTNLTEIEDIGLKAGYYHRTFFGDNNLHTIGMIRATKNSTFTNDCFYNCTSLKNINFEGTIGKNINFQYSPLTALSVHNLFAVLDTETGTDARSVTLKTTSKTAYNDKYGDWDERVAQLTSSGNWTFTLV